MGEGFTWETQDRDRDIAKANASMASLRLAQIQNPEIKLVLLDEINISLKLGYLQTEACARRAELRNRQIVTSFSLGVVLPAR
jgi:ATP:corrinoid adenosyltransferase